jgi:hypothetical protein
MQSAILIVDIPDEMSHPEEQKWGQLQTQVRSALMRTKGTKQLGPNCWQISLGGDLLFLATVVHGAHALGFPCRALFFEKEPSWITGG